VLVESAEDLEIRTTLKFVGNFNAQPSPAKPVPMIRTSADKLKLFIGFI
jgi:hypothetical protein